ncbi:Actin-binding protein IPP [Chelonia mydas]|uniref:Actin-binding protein IPP n=1 Tax=Chelonia mydas TaxID=8469 RepID=M7BFF1_CHEMY|nr:Actin-binding protein IPP [Chelonia mydas]
MPLLQRAACHPQQRPHHTTPKSPIDTSEKPESQTARVNNEEVVLDKEEDEDNYGGQVTGGSSGTVSQELFLTPQQPSQSLHCSMGEHDAREETSNCKMFGAGIVSLLYVYTRDRQCLACGQPGCEDYMKKIECFYRCSPHAAHWINPNYTAGIEFVPLCQNFCDDWYEACKNDSTCIRNWMTDWEWDENGVNHCKNECIPYNKPIQSDHCLHNVYDNQGVSDFSLRVALQTLLKEYCEVCKSPKENKVSNFLQASKARPRRKARKYLYAVGGYTRLQGGRWSDSRALSCVERFDTFSHYWTTVSSLHQARSGLGVAVVGGMVYAIGGEG